MANSSDNPGYAEFDDLWPPTRTAMWAPLKGFAKATGINPGEFEFMGLCQDGHHPKLWCYRSVPEKASLILDVAGHAFDHWIELGPLDIDNGEVIPHHCEAYRDAPTALAEFFRRRETWGWDHV